MPKVSVFLPCYNAHEFIGEALSSVRAQTYPDIEVVILDDGSNDQETLDYLAGLPDDVRVVRQDNKGLPGARNAAIRETIGEYVLPLDCDDWLEPTFVEKTVAALEANPSAGFAFGHMILEGELKGILRKNYNFFEQMFFNQLPYCMMFRRAVLEQSGGYDETMRRGYEDWEMNIRLGRLGWHGVCCPEPLFHYRVTSGGMLKSMSNHYHVQLWQAVQERNAELYTVERLWRIWREWRSKPSTYPLWILPLWWIFCRMMPFGISNYVLRQGLKFYSEARRVNRRA